MEILPVINENETFNNFEDEDEDEDDNDNNSKTGQIIINQCISSESEEDEINERLLSCNTPIFIYFREFTFTHNLYHNSKYIELDNTLMHQTNTKYIDEKIIEYIKIMRNENGTHKPNDETTKYNNCILSLHEIALWCIMEINKKDILRILLDIKNISMFIPCNEFTVDINKKGEIICNYYHNRKLHDLIFNASKYNTEKLINDLVTYDEYHALYTSYALDIYDTKTKRLPIADVEDIEDTEDT